MLGFASALDKFAFANKHRSHESKQLKLKAVIATAESFPRWDSKHLIHEVFGAPVVMEYVTVETGPMAYEKPSGEYTVFWPSFRLEAVESPKSEKRYDLLVICLYSRKMPLIRYKVGDLISDPWPNAGFVLAFPELIGRSHDVVRLKDGTELHFEIIDNAIRHFSFVDQYQIINRPGDDPVLEFLSDDAMDVDRIHSIKQGLSEWDSRLQNVAVQQVEQLQCTISGKHPATLGH